MRRVVRTGSSAKQSRVAAGAGAGRRVSLASSAGSIYGARYPIGVALFAGRQCNAGVPHRSCGHSDAAHLPPTDPQSRGARDPSWLYSAAACPGSGVRVRDYRRVGVEAAGVTGIETTIAIIATGTGVT